MRAVILSERAIADTDALFAAGVAHVARKLGRVKPLDAAALPEGRAEIVAALDLWAGSEVDTWRRELARYYEDHVPVHLRPDPTLNAALRRLSSRGIVLACWSEGPEEAIAIAVHHLGLSRRLERIAVGAAADVAVGLADELAPAREDVLVVADDARALGILAASGCRAGAARWTGRLAAVPAGTLPLDSPDDLVTLVLGQAAVAP